MKNLLHRRILADFPRLQLFACFLSLNAELIHFVLFFVPKMYESDADIVETTFLSQISNGSVMFPATLIG